MEVQYQQQGQQQMQQQGQRGARDQTQASLGSPFHAYRSERMTTFSGLMEDAGYKREGRR